MERSEKLSVSRVSVRVCATQVDGLSDDQKIEYQSDIAQVCRAVPCRAVRRAALSHGTKLTLRSRSPVAQSTSYRVRVPQRVMHDLADADPPLIDRVQPR